jgi:DNA/RNA endonuclease G (NUC1)
MFLRMWLLSGLAAALTSCQSIPPDPPPLDHHTGTAATREAVAPYESPEPATRKAATPYEAPDDPPAPDGKKGGPSPPDFLPSLQANDHLKFGAPRHAPGRNVTTLVRTTYVAEHNNDDKIADWVMFMTKEWVTGPEKRPDPDPFKPDPDLPAGSRSELNDYRNPGYDRGHQCASADSKGRGKDPMVETFYLSNMTPQLGTLNRYGWADLEKRFRESARKRGTIWVVTGPAFIDDDGDGEVLLALQRTPAFAAPTVPNPCSPASIRCQRPITGALRPGPGRVPSHLQGAVSSARICPCTSSPSAACTSC